MSAIEWTDRTWNPCVGCAKVSAGCRHCYAERQAYRVALMEHARGRHSVYLDVIRGEEEAAEGHWNGRAKFLPERLAQPLKWRKPCRVFVNSMSDLFHDDITFEQIAAVFGVMAASPRHTFQVLTKRPARMLEFFDRTGLLVDDGCISTDRCDEPGHPLGEAEDVLHDHGRDVVDAFNERNIDITIRWPLPNVHIGVSVEDQKAADERIPLLMQCPAALRFLSVEPLLGPVDLDYAAFNGCDSFGSMPGIGWVIVGGESGPGARVCDVGWVEEVVKQCRVAGVPCFVKQLGAAAREPLALSFDPPDIISVPMNLRDRKGGDMSEWPEALRVRQFPLTDGELRELGAAFMEDDQP